LAGDEGELEFMVVWGRERKKVTEERDGETDEGRWTQKRKAKEKGLNNTFVGKRRSLW
jgi:hypothetical protein